MLHVAVLPLNQRGTAPLSGGVELLMYCLDAPSARILTQIGSATNSPKRYSVTSSDCQNGLVRANECQCLTRRSSISAARRRCHPRTQPAANVSLFDRVDAAT